jgi:Anti-sigma-K factor rskA
MNTDDIHGLSGAYAVDAVDDVERSLFEAHLADCSQCQIEVASLRAAASEMTLVSQAAPPASLRASILRDISAVRPLPPQMTPEESPASEVTIHEVTTHEVTTHEVTTQAAPVAPPANPESPESAAPSAPASLDSHRSEKAKRLGRAPMRQWLVGVAAAAVLATGGLVWQPWSSDTSTVQLTAMEQVLQAKDAQRFEKKVGQATATIVRSPSLKKAVIVTANMPAPPDGKVYELWLQQGLTMVKAGLMPAGEANTLLLDGDAASAQAVGITVEPAGGSEVPTLPPVAVIGMA